MTRSISMLAALLMVSIQSAQAHDADVARPELLLQQSVEGMPSGVRQEIKVLTATIKPNGKTVFHTHRFPVTVYILEGEFTLEMEGRPAVRVTAGQAFVEPPGVRMTGYNKSASTPMKVVIFYVSDPQSPFLDPVKTD